MQTLKRAPLLTGTEYRRLGGDQVLGDLAPADAAVDLDEVAAPVDFGTQGAAAFQLAVDLALQLLDFDEGILGVPKRFEGFSENQLCRHARPL